MSSLDLSGVWIPIVTPFRAGRVDHAALATLVRRLAADGVAGFVVCATTGEAPLLADAERVEVLGTIRAATTLPLVMAITLQDALQRAIEHREIFHDEMLSLMRRIMIFYLAALQSMSPHLAEAGAIEGASRGYFFRRVTFPLLMPTTLFVLVNAVINAFRLVDHVVVMTRGGPDNATSLLLYYIFEIGFRFWDSSYAAALTMVLLTLLAAVAIAQFVFLERRTHYQ